MKTLRNLAFWLLKTLSNFFRSSYQIARKYSILSVNKYGFRAYVVIAIFALVLIGGISSVLADDIAGATNNFSVIGTVSEIHNHTINLVNASGSNNPSVNAVYELNIDHVEKVETSSYSVLSFEDVAIGDKVIAQGLTDGSNFFIKRIISFSADGRPRFVKQDSENINTATSSENTEADIATTTYVTVATTTATTTGTTTDTTNSIDDTKISTTTDVNIDDVSSTTIKEITQSTTTENISTTTDDHKDDSATSTGAVSDVINAVENLTEKVVDTVKDVVNSVVDTTTEVIQNIVPDTSEQTNPVN